MKPWEHKALTETGKMFPKRSGVGGSRVVFAGRFDGKTESLLVELEQHYAELTIETILCHLQQQQQTQNLPDGHHSPDDRSALPRP